MVVGIVRERMAGENRVASTPETVGKLKAKGFAVLVEKGAGSAANFSDAEYLDAGAELAETAEDVLDRSDIVVKIQPPSSDEVKRFKSGAVLIAAMRPFNEKETIENLAERGVSVFALEMVPRITRAQSMDILSSQANLAGYKAVLLAANTYQGLLPMFMTAAGTVRPAKVLVIGAGVAGLQAIATAKRLGAVVSSFDIRSAVKEQVKSLGAKFVEIDLGIGDAETSGGYARELNDEERARQVELLGEHIKKMDIVITTAAVPGRPSPRLISAATVAGMKPGSVIVDLAAEGGGNCELTEKDETVLRHGVTLIGTVNLPSLLAGEASNLFSRNVVNFLFNMLDKEGHFAIDRADEIVAGSLVAHDGRIVHPMLGGSQTA